MSEVGTVTHPIMEESVEEARSFLATIVANIISLIRTLMIYVSEIARKIITWIGEHPLATLLMVVNVSIWVS